MASQLVQYGDFTFPFTKVSAEEEPIYAEDNATVVGTSYLFSIRGTIAKDTIEDFVCTVGQMRLALAKPRQQLRIQWSEDGGGFQTLFGFDGAGTPGSTTDIDYGPKPMGLSFTDFAGGKAAIYYLKISVKAKECTGGSACSITSTTHILSLTRQFSHSIDADGFTRRTVSGVLQVTASESLAGRDADTYRALCRIPVPPNFKAIEQSFELSADGRYLRYSVSDQEVMWTLPKPVSSGRVSFVIRARGLGLLCDYCLSGELCGTTSASKGDLLAAVGDLIANRFPDGGAMNGPHHLFYDSREVGESVYDNKITFSWNAHNVVDPADPTPTADNVGAWVLGNFGAKPPGSDSRAQTIGPYGGDGQGTDSGVAGQGPSLYDACTSNISGGPPGLSGTPNTAIIVGSPGDAPRPTGAPTPGQDSYASDDHKTGPYIAYRDTVSYQICNNIAVFQPKKRGTAPVTQQTAPPLLRIIQAGYAERDGVPPQAPDPLYSDNLRIEDAYVSAPNGEPLGGSGQSRYSINWRYISVYTDSIEDGVYTKLQPKYPKDPRLASDPPDMAEFPALTESTDDDA